MIPQPPDPRQQYEALLNAVLDEVHSLVEHAEQPWKMDDSKVHVLVQRLRDEFGPEVKS